MPDVFERLRAALENRYAIEGELGAGGMATVYLARDRKHGRQVALKVLKPELAATLGPERFVREIEIATRLTHPHILPVHDSGEAAGFLYYIMPYVEGESLRERLNRERQLPIVDALQISREVAAALAYAHSYDIVHRDIKPENILLSGGVAVVADFGIARAVSAAAGEQLTATGLAVGTPAYMSPEQASGERDIDGRSDIYSLGCVLYEMLAGEPPFAGSSMQAITAAKLTAPVPEIRMIRDTVSPAVSQVVQTALARLPADRFQTAEMLAERLRASAEEAPSVITKRGLSAVPLGVIPWAVAALMTLVAVWLAVTGRTAQPASEPLTYRYTIPVSGDHRLPRGARVGGVEPVPIALSPDGAQLVYVGEGDSGTQLYVRTMDGFESRPIPGTERALNPFFSPDGKWVGFAADGMLKRVSVEGGPVQAIAEAPNILGATWMRSDSIIFTPDYTGGLSIVSASGGTALPVTTPDPDNREFGHLWPHLLPDGKTVLFDRWHQPDGHSIAWLSLETREQKVILENAGKPRYLLSGHLAFERFNQVQAQVFDLGNQTVTGASFPPIDAYKGFFTVSAVGSMVYVPPVPDPAHRRLVWVSRTGQATPLAELSGLVLEPQLSPDGGRLLLLMLAQQGPGVYAYDLASERLELLGTGFFPIWTPDGRGVTWGGTGLFRQRADGTPSDPEKLTESESPSVPFSWSPDGKALVYGTGADIWVVSLEGDRTPRPLVATEHNELGARFSPDGKWIAYISDVSGQQEIYLQSYPDAETRRLVSSGGGSDPVWTHDGRELFYRRGDEMWVVSLEIDPILTIGTPQLLFTEPYAARASHQNYDYDPNRDRFIMSPVETMAPTELRVVLNWFAELERLVPSGRR
jgi:serine/threonine-protein kinase